MNYSGRGSRLGRFIANIAVWFGRSRHFAGAQTEVASRAAPLLAPGLPPNLWVDTAPVALAAPAATFVKQDHAISAEADNSAVGLLWSRAQTFGESPAAFDPATLGAAQIFDANTDFGQGDTSEFDALDAPSSEVQSQGEDADIASALPQLVKTAGPNLLARQLRGVSRLNKPRRSANRPAAHRGSSASRAPSTKPRRQPEAWILARSSRTFAA